MTKASNKAIFKVHERFELQKILYIHYIVQFIEFFIETLIASDSKINIIQPNFARKLSIRICKTNINAKKIDNSRLETYEMIIASFQVNNKDKKFSFFEKAFLLTNINMDIAFRQPFLILSNIEVKFNN